MSADYQRHIWDRMAILPECGKGASPGCFVDDDAGDAAIDCIAHAGRRSPADARLIGGVRLRVGSRVDRVAGRSSDDAMTLTEPISNFPGMLFVSARSDPASA